MQVRGNSRSVLLAYGDRGFFKHRMYTRCELEAIQGVFYSPKGIGDLPKQNLYKMSIRDNSKSVLLAYGGKGFAKTKCIQDAN